MSSFAPDMRLMQQDHRYGKNGDHQSDNIIFIHKILCMCGAIFSFAFCMENCNPRWFKLCAKSMHIQRCFKISNKFQLIRWKLKNRHYLHM